MQLSVVDGHKSVIPTDQPIMGVYKYGKDTIYKGSKCCTREICLVLTEPLDKFKILKEHMLWTILLNSDNFPIQYVPSFNTLFFSDNCKILTIFQYYMFLLYSFFFQTKGTSSFGKRHNKTHTHCRRCGRRAYHIQKKRCASCSYPSPTGRTCKHPLYSDWLRPFEK